MLIFYKFFFVLLLLLSLLIGSSLIYSNLVPFALILSLASLTLSFFFPFQTLCLFCTTLPIFGNRPGTSQSTSLMLVSASILAGFILHLFFKKKLGSIPINKILLITSLYLFASLISLSGLPVVELVRNFGNMFSFASFEESILSIGKLLSIDELNVYYSFASFVNTTLAFGLGLCTFIYLQGSKHSALTLFYSLFAGLLASFCFGLLDYYEVINLRTLRELDPVVNPNDTQFRLQSFFGHSGWYAEYVTFLIPLVILFLLLPIKYLWRVLLCLFIIILGEYILILTYQRGGWLSYPLTLFIVWTAIYIFRIYEKGEASSFFLLIRKSLKKILISVPITVVLSIVLISFLSNSEESILSKYTYRLKEISKVSDRSEFFKSGFNFGLLHPFAGGGSESYGYQYEREVNSPNGRHFNQYNLPLHGSAHNFYMQIFSGKGILGLFLILAIIFSILKSSYHILTGRSIGEEKLDNQKRAILLISVSFLAAVLIYGNVQEVFYIQVLQILFFLFVFIFAATFKDDLSVYDPRKYTTRFLLLVFLHFSWEYYLPGYNSKFLPENYGCYQQEADPNNNKFRWCSKRFAMTKEINRLGATPYVEIDFSTFQTNQKEAYLKVFAAGKEIYHKQLQANTNYKEKIAILDKNFRKDKTINLEFTTNAYFIPKLHLENSNDSRILAIKINEK